MSQRMAFGQTLVHSIPRHGIEVDASAPKSSSLVGLVRARHHIRPVELMIGKIRAHRIVAKIIEIFGASLSLFPLAGSPGIDAALVDVPHLPAP